MKIYYDIIACDQVYWKDCKNGGKKTEEVDWYGNHHDRSIQFGVDPVCVCCFIGDITVGFLAHFVDSTCLTAM